MEHPAAIGFSSLFSVTIRRGSLVSHFRSGSPLLGTVEKALTPVTRRLGWRADVDLQGLLGGARLDVRNVERVNAFGYWRLVHCVNDGRTAAAAAQQTAGSV